MEIAGLYELLLDASIAGVPYYVVDTGTEAGRRMVRFLFPGQDQAAWQDLGAIEGAISISGVLVGDDYAEQAANLRTALLRPGPWTLIDPWLGTLMVMPAPRQLPDIRFRHDELRVARFRLMVMPWRTPAPALPDTLAALEGALDDVRTGAGALLDAVLAPAALSLAAIGYVERFGNAMAAQWTLLAGDAGGAVAAAAVAPVAALGTINTVSPLDDYADGVTALLSAVGTAIAAASTPVAPAAVAPGGNTALPVPVDGRIAANLLLSAAAFASGYAADPAPGPALSAVQQSLALCDAVGAASDIAFASQQEARTWLGTLDAALATAAAQAAVLAATQATAGGALWRALTAARAALAADMSAIIGRLPAVATFTLARVAPLWLIAQHLAGDDPSQVVPTYLDLASRNAIANPGAVPPGILEVLRAA